MRGTWTVLALFVAACSSSDMTVTIDAASGTDGPIVHIDAQTFDAQPSTDVCHQAPLLGEHVCAMPGPGGTFPECTTDKACTVTGCGQVSHDPDCVDECNRCNECARCNRSTGQWIIESLQFCVPTAPCPDGGMTDAGGST